MIFSLILIFLLAFTVTFVILTLDREVRRQRIKTEQLRRDNREALLDAWDEEFERVKRKFDQTD